MKTIFFHIGQHRTGTTTLQWFLNTNRDALLKQRILYPVAGKVDLNGNDYPRHFYLSFRDSSDKKTLQELSDEINHSEANRVIISAEGFCRASVNDSIKRNVFEIFDKLAEHKIKVICYLRPQEDFIESFYNWKVKDGWEHRNFYEFVDVFIREWKNYLYYDKLIEPFQSKVGSKNIIIKPYYRKKLYQKCIIHDFCQIAGIKLQGFEFPSSDRNARLPLASIEVVRRLNSLLKKRPENSLELSVFINEIIKSKITEKYNSKSSLLTHAKRTSLRQIFLNSNTYVENEYLNQSRLFDPPVRLKYIPPEEITKVSEDDLFVIIYNLWTQKIQLERIKEEKNSTIVSLGNELQRSLRALSKMQNAYDSLQKKAVLLEQKIAELHK